MRIYIDAQTRKVYCEDDLYDMIPDREGFDDLLDEALSVYDKSEIDEDLCEKLYDEAFEEYLNANFDIYDVEENGTVKEVNIATAW